MNRSFSDESLDLITEIEFSRKIKRTFFLSILICSFGTLLLIFVGRRLNRPSMVDIARKQALDHYSKIHHSFNHHKASRLFHRRQKAVIVIVCRNSDLSELLTTLLNFEKRFNHKFRYPYVLLNDKPFRNGFKHQIENLISRLSQANVKFGTIPVEHWSYPTWINQTRAGFERRKMEQDGVMYGGSESYRHMCRYFSGFMHDHPLLSSYELYWRIEPGVSFLCDIPFDPFQVMVEEKKQYGFVIAFGELPNTIPTLWEKTLNFSHQNPYLIPKDNCFDYFQKTTGEYNHCHFWSNFEIASFSLFRSQSYRAFFRYLDEQGGFFYERWGDAPVHSLAVGLFLRKDEVMYFDEIGYKHNPFSHCPVDSNWRRDQNCKCDPFDQVDQTHSECQRQWNQL